MVAQTQKTYIMKDLEFEITWDRLTYGEFPIEETKECDPNLDITIDKISNFKQKVKFKTLLEDNENELEMVFYLGTFIHSTIRRKQAYL